MARTGAIDDKKIKNIEDEIKGSRKETATLNKIMIWLTVVLVVFGLISVLQGFGWMETSIIIIPVFLLSIAYFLYMKKELRGGNLGLRSRNGCGEGLYGKKDIREDGSYVSTKWFMILLIPIIPLGTYRIWKGETLHSFVADARIGIQQSTEIRTERLKMDWQQIFLTYIVVLVILGLITFLIYRLFDFNF